jgi:hypothetical protein
VHLRPSLDVWPGLIAFRHASPNFVVKVFVFDACGVARGICTFLLVGLVQGVL